MAAKKLKPHEKLAIELRGLSDEQLARRLEKAEKASAKGSNIDSLTNDDWMVLEILGEQMRREEEAECAA